jgi:hypothetical protein
MPRNDLLLIYLPRLSPPPFPRLSPQGTPDGGALLPGILEVRGQLQLSVSNGRESQRPCQNPHLTTHCSGRGDSGGLQLGRAGGGRWRLLPRRYAPGEQGDQDRCPFGAQLSCRVRLHESSDGDHVTVY